MLGAIIGDIVGSQFEFNNHRSKEFDLFGKGCFATDDSIMTFAVAKAIMETERAAAYMSENSGGAAAFRALYAGHRAALSELRVWRTVPSVDVQ